MCRGASPVRLPFSRRLAAVLLLSAIVCLPPHGCTGRVDVEETFEVVDLAGGYYDGGIVDGRNRLLPGVKFRIAKKSDVPVKPFSVNVLFKKVVGGAEEEFDDVFLQRVEIAEGNRTREIVARADTGITGDAPQSRAEILKNSYFVDMRAVVYVKQSSSTWVELARYDLPRQLVTQ